MVGRKIKKRVIYAYPSLEQADRWKETAEKQGLSISSFVVEHVENSLRQEEDPSFEPRSELVKRIRKLQDELAEARKEARMLNIVTDKLEKENRRLRSEPFFEEEFQGVRRYEKDLVELLMSGRRLSEDQILSELGIDRSDGDLVKAISKQLASLEVYGLVEASPHGWKWSK